MGARGKAEQGLEGRQRGAPPVETKGELVQVGLEVIVTDAVGGAATPGREVANDVGDVRQERSRPHGARPLGRRPHQRGPAMARPSAPWWSGRRVWSILVKMEGTDARSARQGFTKKLRHVPAPLRKTLTYDRGNERAEHERLAQRLAIRIFFADPYRPWQRGTKENTNGLRRQYVPKGTDWSGYTQRELNAIAHRLNTRPRKCLNVATPLEVFTHLRLHSPVARGT